MEKTKYYCKKCKQETEMIVIKLHRLKGVKLSCMNCSQTTKWVNAKMLKI